MKKLLAMCLVLSMATLANAAVLEVVTYDVGLSGPRTGTSYNPLLPSDIIGVAVVVGYNPYPGYPAYSGYLVSSVDIDLHAVGPGSLSYNTDKLGNPVVATDLDSLIVDDAVGGDLPRLQGISLAGINGRDGAVIADLLFFHCDDIGNVILDITLLGLTEYSPYATPTGQPYPGGWLAAMESDFGDLVIHQIPEPMTMILLGLGSVGLLRRRR
jgi:hypothetical protein